MIGQLLGLLYAALAMFDGDGPVDLENRLAARAAAVAADPGALPDGRGPMVYAFLYAPICDGCGVDPLVDVDRTRARPWRTYEVSLWREPWPDECDGSVSELWVVACDDSGPWGLPACRALGTARHECLDGSAR